eukprot:1156940-Pelagomonas_calceolata.AAC.4
MPPYCWHPHKHRRLFSPQNPTYLPCSCDGGHCPLVDCFYIGLNKSCQHRAGHEAIGKALGLALAEDQLHQLLHALHTSTHRGPDDKDKAVSQGAQPQALALVL